ncbi:putative translation regulator [Trypoxylus dichotomus]
MSYVFVHPAFDKEDKKSFRQLLRHVLNRVSPENFIHSPVNESSDESVSPNPEQCLLNTSSCRLNRRSNSLTPAQTSSNENLTPTVDVWSSQENLQHSSKPRSYSLSNDKTFPLNIATLQASSSETRLQDLQTLNNSPAMRSIVSWLKSLRLHKYSWVFNNITYEQMLSLTEESLQSIGITKGARHKLLLSIGKLKERGTMLMELETEVMNGGDLLNALKKLKGVLQTPLQVTSGEDLPSLFVKVMGKVCTQLLMRRQTSEECFLLFISLSERVENSDVFNEEQKRRLSMWREQLIHVNHIPSYAHRQQNNNSYRNHGVPSPYLSPATESSLQQIYSHKSSSYPNMQKNPGAGAHRHSVGSIALTNILQSATPMQNMQLLGCDTQQNSNGHHVRFQDAELESKNKKALLKNVDIESSLESLCLQMMEHALGP